MPSRHQNRHESTRTATEGLVLARLLDSGRLGLAPRKLESDLRSIVDPAASGDEDRQGIGPALEALVTTGRVARSGTAKSAKLQLTEAGRKDALEYLGLSALVEGTPWKTIRDVHLVAKALGFEPTNTDGQDDREQLGKIAVLRAAILRRAHALGGKGTPGFDEVLGKLLWKLLDRDTGETAPRFTLKAVEEHLLNRFLGAERPLPLAQLKTLLPARAVGARRGDASELRLALLRDLVRGDADAPRSPATSCLHSANPGSTEERPADDGDRESATQASDGLEDLARDILDSARASETGWFGRERVFINHAWRSFVRMPRLPPAPTADLEAFKTTLVDLHARGLVTLGRADLVEVLDRNDVAESETRSLGACFHFLRVSGGRS